MTKLLKDIWNKELGLINFKLGPVIILLSMVFSLGFCSGSVIAEEKPEAVQNLEDFLEGRGKKHRPPPGTKNPVSLKTKKVGQTPDSRDNRVLLQESLVTGEEISSLPLRVGHTPETLHSFSVLKKGDDYYGHVNVQLFGGQYNEFPFIRKWLGEVQILDPIVEGGIISDFSGEDVSFSLSLRTMIRKAENGIGFKALFRNHDYKELLKTTYGRIMVYYYYSKTFLFSDFDFASFYLGWYSPPLQIDLNNLDEFTGKFKGLIKQSENMIAGIYYQPSVGGRLSYSVEAGINNFSASFYCRL